MLLPDHPSGRHTHLLRTPVRGLQVDLVVQVYRAANVVRDDLDRVAHPEVAVLAYGEHSVLLRDPPQYRIGISNHMAEPDQAERCDLRLRVCCEGLASAVDDDEVRPWPAHHCGHNPQGAVREGACPHLRLHPVVEDVGAWPDLRDALDI